MNFKNRGSFGLKIVLSCPCQKMSVLGVQNFKLDYLLIQKPQRANSFCAQLVFAKGIDLACGHLNGQNKDKVFFTPSEYFIMFFLVGTHLLGIYVQYNNYGGTNFNFNELIMLKCIMKILKLYQKFKSFFQHVTKFVQKNFVASLKCFFYMSQRITKLESSIFIYKKWPFYIFFCPY